MCGQPNSQPETPAEGEEGDCMIGNVRGRDGGTQQRGKEMRLVVGSKHGLEKIIPIQQGGADSQI